MTPSVIVFDVNETLSDMSSMGERFAEAGAPPGLAATWFASVLRDGFALAAAGASAPFAEIAAENLRGALAGTDAAGSDDIDVAVERIVAAVGELPTHADVPAGVRALHAGGRRLVTLTNGSTAVTEKIVTGAGVHAEFDAFLSVEDAGRWKPHPASYGYAVRYCGSAAADLLLVAAHPWDVDGAARAGLATAWVNRTAARYPGHLLAPDWTVRDLPELAATLDG